GLPNDNVRTVLVDRNGTAWAGTANGLGRFDGGGWTAFSERNGLPGASIIALAGAPDGSLWFGMDGGGLGRVGPDGRLAFWSRRDGLARGVVLSLRFEGDGETLWIGTNGGLSRLRHDRLDSWTTQQGLPSDNVAQVGEDAAGALW